MAVLPFHAERPTLAPALVHRFGSFQGVALDELDSFALLNRVDTKFALTLDQAEQIFARVEGRYRILEIDGRRASHYRTLYFDTPDLGMYHAHHNGERDRFKVRIRSYLDSNVTYFEIKRKTNRDRTIKVRITTPHLDQRLTAPMCNFLHENTPYLASALVPGVANDFLRVSFVGVDDVERLTLDFSLSLALAGRSQSLPGLVIAEVKQPKFSTNSPFVQQVRALRIEPIPFSKYCHAVAALEPRARSNRFKERMLFLDRLVARGGSA